MPTQYQLTDQAIHAAAAADGVILSKVPGHGTDKIGIRRIDSKGRPVLYDIEGTAIKTAFGVEKYHWENGEDMCGPIQKASFQNHGKDTASGSKPTYKNITVSGMPSYTAPEPVKRSPAKPAAAGASAAAAASSSSSKRKFDRFTSDMTEGELAELQAHVRSAISAKKASKKAADSSKKKMEAKLAKMREDKAKRLQKMEEEEAKLQAALEAMDSGASSSSPAKAVAASPAKSPQSEENPNRIYLSFVSSRATVATHYNEITGEEPAKSWTASQMRSKLIHEHYSEDQLRQLGNGAGIHGSIKKAATLRTHLGQHFSPMLSD